jgi:hypothetical protein
MMKIDYYYYIYLTFYYLLYIYYYYYYYYRSREAWGIPTPPSLSYKSWNTKG